MMPGPHQSAVPPHSGRRQADHQYYHMPPQTHSPVHNPYAHNPYHHPQHYAAPHASPYHQQMPQWYNPYHQPPPPPPPQPQHHQYAMPPRNFQPHGSPVVVSSHPHMAPMAPVNRVLGQTPPIAHSRTPPAPRIPTPQRTPQPLPSTPSVTSQTHISSPTPPINMATSTPPPTTPSMSSVATAPPSLQPGTFMPYYPQLPWQSFKEGSMPPRASKNRKNRRRKTLVPSQQAGLALPSREQAVEADGVKEVDEPLDEAEQTPTEGPDESLASTVAPASEADIDTPSTSHPPSEADITHPATSSPTTAPSSTRPTAPTHSHTRTQTKPVVPLIPIRSAKAPSVTSTTQKSTSAVGTQDLKKTKEVTTPTPSTAADGSPEETPKASLPPPAAPKSWAELLRSKAAPIPVQTPAAPNGVVSPNGPSATKSNSLGDVLASFSVDSDKKLSFLEPRGLVNTGNVCYMNSVGPPPSLLLQFSPLPSWPS